MQGGTRARSGKAGAGASEVGAGCAMAASAAASALPAEAASASASPAAAASLAWPAGSAEPAASLEAVAALSAALSVSRSPPALVGLAPLKVPVASRGSKRAAHGSAASLLEAARLAEEASVSGGSPVGDDSPSSALAVSAAVEAACGLRARWLRGECASHGPVAVGGADHGTTFVVCGSRAMMGCDADRRKAPRARPLWVSLPGGASSESCSSAGAGVGVVKSSASDPQVVVLGSGAVVALRASGELFRLEQPPFSRLDLKKLVLLACEGGVCAMVSRQRDDSPGGVLAALDLSDGRKLCEVDLPAPQSIVGQERIKAGMFLLTKQRELVGLWPWPRGDKHTVRVVVFSLDGGAQRAFDVARQGEVGYFSTSLQAALVPSPVAPLMSQLLLLSVGHQPEVTVVDLDMGQACGPRLHEAEPSGGASGNSAEPPPLQLHAKITALAGNLDFFALGLEQQRFDKKEVVKVFCARKGHCVLSGAKGGAMVELLRFHPSNPDLLLSVGKYEAFVRVWGCAGAHGTELFRLGFEHPSQEIIRLSVSDRFLCALLYEKHKLFGCEEALLYVWDFDPAQQLEQAAKRLKHLAAASSASTGSDY